MCSGEDTYVVVLPHGCRSERPVDERSLKLASVSALLHVCRRERSEAGQ
jgi:hypothetical protein